MTIHKKFSIPVACFVFALLGLALGVSNRKDGKLASFVLGIAVIFVYYVIMFMAQAMTKGGMIPAWLAMWLPNIVLGDCRRRAADVAAPVRRDQPIRHLAAALACPRWTRIGVPARRPAPRLTPRPRPTPQADRVVVVIRIPQFELPRPNLLDIYVARQYLRILAMTIVGHAGAVLHLHVHRSVGQVVQGPGDARADPVPSCGGRHRSSCPTSSRSPCCSPRS